MTSMLLSLMLIWVLILFDFSEVLDKLNAPDFLFFLVLWTTHSLVCPSPTLVATPCPFLVPPRLPPDLFNVGMP